MYTNRNIYDQEGQLLFRKNRPGTSAEDHQTLTVNNRHLCPGSEAKQGYTQTEPLKNKLYGSDVMTETINTAHFKCLFQAKSEKLLERPTQILSHILFCPQYDLFRFLIDTLCCQYEWVYHHSVNVALISLMIADKLGLDEKQQETLAIGALLHDVGKLKVPKEILEKESSLNDEEMALMIKHSEFGIELAAGYSLPQEVLDVILQHHERLDGSGYPYGLHADEISLFAKITMIADVIDAVTSQRPYRPARNIETAMQIVKEEGAKFCTEYVTIIDDLREQG